MNIRYFPLLVVVGAFGAAAPAQAHDWHRHDDPQFANVPFISPYATGPKAGAVKLFASAKDYAPTASDAGASSASSPTSFTPATLSAATLFAQTFVKFNPAVRFWWDSTNFYVEGDGTPAHSMMVGISSWQRQIPVPPYYFGTNIWALPLYPVATATNELVATNKFTQGAIALAANGIPIFNPYNNTGRISAQIGELDLWGGHCGRGDDYHYHAAPLHLTNTLGIALPVAFAMDGYPVYGLVEPDGSVFATNTLDNVAGHTNGTGSYHYHASPNFPYVNGGFHGVITIVTNGTATQAGIQPKAGGVRPAGTPLAGAYIQIFTNIAPDQFQMFYSLPSNSSPAFATNYWLYTLNRAGNSVSVTYSSYDGVSGSTTTNYNNWKPAPAFTSTNEPLVTTQPTNLTRVAGSNASFSITAAGFGALAYQWFKDGVELANGSGIGGVSTTTLNVTNVQVGDAGAYSVVVTNTVGNTMSASAILTVNGSATNTPPTLSPIANRIVIPGQTLLITNVANDAETPGLLSFSLNSSLPGPTINTTNGLITWITTTNNANSTNQLSVVVADNGSPNLLATQSCTVTVVGTRSISQGLAATITSNLFPAGQRVSGVGTITAFDGTVWTVPAATPFAASPKVPDLWNQNAGVTPTNIAAAATAIANLTTNVIDADGEVITGYIFCDNYFELFINGVLVGVDPVPYTPFNSCVVKFKARRPITYAVRLVDWEENLGVGTELNGGDPNHSGDGGFIASFSDGTVTGPNWKAQSFYIAPLDNPNLVVEMPDGSHNSSSASNSTTLGTNAYALHYLVPTNWYAKTFNHSNWPAATTYTEAQVGVNNLWAYLNFPGQFGSSGAQFIWSGNLVLDNEVIVRFTGSASNTAPQFTALATNRYVINGGDTLVVTNAATDADVPAQTLTYSLPAAPGGASINTNTGAVTWVSTTNFYNTTNLFRVVVTDNGSPQLSATNTFTAVVNPPFAAFSGSLVFLRPTTNSIALNALSLSNVTAYFEYGASSGLYTDQTQTTNLVANQPLELLLTGLQPNTRYFYRARLQYPGDTSFKADVERSFMTQRAPGNPFIFTIFGDTHPERVNVMFDTNFYNLTLNTVAADKPDFQMLVGDDFSVDTIPTNQISQATVEARYTLQRPYLAQVANSASLFLVNGNHEEASRWAYLNTNLVAPGVNLVTYSNIAVWAQNARNKFFPMPMPDGFYSGMTNDSLPDIGPLRSSYAWTWGDALFVTIDPYWYSSNSVDTAYGTSAHPNGSVWLISHGDPQYFWLKSTLENSRAKFKFVFAHHVMGTGRGGADDASFYEWGGKNQNGTWGFDVNRPNWPDPIHQLMVANNVTAFLQGHDHIWVHQQLDGLVYQTLPNPADNRYSLFNADAYTNNLIYKTGNSGYGRFSVGPTGVQVDYVRTIMPTNLIPAAVGTNGAPPGVTNGAVDYSYIIYPFTISTATNTPAPTATNTVWVTALANSGTNITNMTLTYVVGTTSNTIAMFDDGAHHDGTNGDGVYGAQIPAFPLGTVVRYYLHGVDASTRQATEPSGAPINTNLYSYVVGNTPPVLAPISNYSIQTNTTLLVTNAATDTDVPAQTLTFTLPAKPTGANINANSGLISWTPTSGQANTTNPFTVVVTDNGTPNLSATQSFTVIVLGAPGSNTAPVLGVITNRTISVGGTLFVTNVATDAESPPQVLTYALPVAPTNAAINAGSGVISWTPLAGQANTTNTFTTVATDNGTPTLSVTNSFLVTVLSDASPLLTIAGVANSPAAPTSNDLVWVTATIASSTTVTQAVLSYSTGAGGAGTTNVVFSETMAAITNAAWDGTGTDNLWTVVTTGGAGNIKQQSNANHTAVGAGGQCGMEMGKGTTNASENMVTTASNINATGASGYVEFWVGTVNVTNGLGWTFQLSTNGTTFITRTNESDGTVHGLQKYHYDLLPSELVSTLKIRFQFIGNNVGGPTGPKVRIDDIIVATATAGGAAYTNVALLDDGAHQDGGVGDGVYGAQIPALPTGTAVNYYLTAANSGGLSATNPVGAPATNFSYTVTTNSGAAPTVTYDLLLGRPTDTSIAVSLLASNNLTAYYEYGTASGIYTGQSATNAVTNGIPSVTTMSGLAVNQKYFYRLRYSTNGIAPFTAGTERTFRTQRARGSTFTFLIEADPHNRDNVPDVWKLAFTNMLADNADFLLDLGDTFFEEKVAATNAYYLTRPGIFDLHQEVRNGFFGLAGHSLPTFLVSGNHDPELGWLLSGTNNPAVWGAQARQYFYPVPVPSPGGFYSGATNIDPYTLSPRDGYYAFEWGDALFVTLDPYWYSAPKPNADGWSWTLGTNQYYWLKQTLETSTAKFKFVFAHHLIGGGGGGEARGGLTYHTNFEWGGSTTNGGYDFPTKRPGWPAPIKDLLLSNNVQAFFHGHDHLYVKEEFYKPGNSNGVPDFIYQEVPQPSQTIFSTNSAAGYAYTNSNSTVIAGSGHLRVTISPTNALVEYLRVFRPVDEGAGKTNRMISHSYNIPAPVVSNAWSMLKLPDTGQTTSYTTVPGEDSDYSINPPSYTDNGNGTTTDNVTGLMWQKADGGEMTISNALLFAQTNLNPVNFAGYNDWRMPTIHELASILNNDRSNPALDTNYFTSPGATNFAQVYWWSRDQLRNGTNQWCANAGGGVGPKPISETISAGGTLNYRVRCVRGAAAPATNSPIHHFVNNGNGTITDSDTSLTWQQAEIGATTDWTNALIYAEGLVLGGFQDWRLPNLKELESLNDETLGSPSMDTNYFPGAKSARYWSSTTQNNAQTNAWFNEFITGITSQAPKTTNYWVRAVRGGLSNTAPQLTAISNRTINAGVTLLITNTATDTQTAPGFLTFSLLTSLTNAAINSTSGVFTWRPAVAQAGTTNIFTVVVADTGSPILNATQLFSITVNPLTNPPGVAALNYVGNQLQLQIKGDAGPDYTVLASTNLSDWTNILFTNSPNVPFNWTDTNAGSFLKRFYRVLLGP